MENCISISTLFAFILLVQPIICAKPLAKITVEAGKHTRIDTPVSIALDGMSYKLLGLQEIKGSKRLPVASQIEPGNPPRLWWILSGTTAAGTKRVYELLDGFCVEAATVEAIKNDSFLQIQTKGRPVLRYHHAAVPPPKGVDNDNYIRSGFIHPLWSPTGAILTNIHPPDHLHHMGIWMPWTKTRFEGREVDFWNLGKGEGTVRFVRFLSTTSGPVYGGFQAEQEHVALKTSEGEKVVLKEIWDVRVYNVGGPEKGYWLWDFVSTQRCASDSPLHLLKYRYGGLGFRGAAEWEGKNAMYLTSEGKTRKDGHATRARWCDMAGRVAGPHFAIHRKMEALQTPKNAFGGPEAIKGKWAGVVIMSHPQNFRHPEPMRIWPEGQVFFNFAPSQLGDWTIMPGKDYLFRYRFYVHEGKIRIADAERIWYDFAQPPKVRLEKILHKISRK